MHIKMFYPFLSLFLLMIACNPKVSQKISGTWQMQKVYDNSSDVTEEHNPARDRWITFLSDGSFQSGGEPYGNNGGKWTYDDETNVLYLDSDAGEGDDSYWNLKLNQQEMVWSGTKSSFTSRFRISFTKE